MTWTTDQASSSVVNYGLTASYGTTASSATLVTSHSAALSSLTCNTLYQYQASSTNASGQTSTSADQTLTTAACSAPVISAISATPTSTSATVTWTTDQASSSVVNYGLTASYGTTASSATLVTSHSAALSVTCNTLYHYQVSSTNASGQTSTSA